MNPTKAILGGFVGTALFTIMLYYVAPLVLGAPMDIAAMLGSMMGNNWAWGMTLHWILGSIVFPLAYIWVAYKFLPGSPTVRGITWGVFLWLLSETAVLPSLGGGFFSANAGGWMAVGTSLVSHVIYGATLGAIAGSARTREILPPHDASHPSHA